MRKIDKGDPIAAFTRFLRTKPCRWEDVPGKDRCVWRKYISEREQHRLSGYTELPLADKTHIDHFKIRELFPNLTFCWDNFIVDNNDDSYGARYKDCFITTQADNERLINPAEENAACFFRYEVTGKMIPAIGLTEEEKDRAQFTIKAFNLNEESLKDRRKRILCLDLSSYDGLSDDDVRESFGSMGFPSVVEQCLQEHRSQENMI